MTQVHVSVFNVQDGGLAPNGSFGFTGLRQAFTDDPSPDLIILCEAKFWNRRGRRPFLTAMHELSLLHARPYVGELHSGPLGTAVIYDPTIVCLTAAEEPEFADARNRTEFQLRATGQPLRVYAEHWSYCDPHARFTRAQRLAQHGESPVPTLIAGDLNESASGDDFPDLDWTSVPIAVRDYAGHRSTDGHWHRQTRALDRLIGRATPGRRARLDGAGFHHVGELDLQAPRPFPATSNARNLHVDHALVNNALLRTARVVPGSYQVHVPRGRIRTDWPSDHRRVSFTLAFLAGPIVERG
jgi:endonuclease/exonuclease/phosphatase family metal-dependent hydrolase